MGRIRAPLLGTGLWVAAGACAVAMGGPAAAQTRVFDVPAQPAATGLTAFARQADVQILAAASAVRGQRTSRVVGRYSIEEGLKRLISGANLKVATNDGRTIILHPSASRPNVRVAGAGSGAATREKAARPPSPNEEAPLEQVIVTARKFEEDLQRTPLAVTAFTAGDLRARAAQNFSDLQYSTLSLTMGTSSTGSNSPLIQMRGQTQSTFQFVVDPTIGIYVDGVYNTATFGLKGEGLLDVERVEILKGPQGTLYGKNTTGGALSIYTNRPGDVFGGELDVGTGAYGRRVASAAVNIPLVPDKLALRIAGLVERRDGYGVNAFDGRPLNDQDDRTLRAALRFDPTENLSIILRGDAGRSRTSGVLTQPIYMEPGLTANLEAAAETFGVSSIGDPAALDRARVLYNAQAAAARADPYRASLNDPERTASDVAGGSLTMTYDFGDLALKSITAYRSVVDLRQYDIDATSVLHLAGLSRTVINQFTQELQLTGAALDGRLKYAGGFFYYRVAATDGATMQVFPRLTNSGVTVAAPRIHNRSPAFYGQATYEVIANLNITAGLRWTREKKEVDNIQFAGNTATIDGRDFTSSRCNLGLPAGGLCTIHFEFPDENLSYNLAVDWTPAPDVLLYARTSRSYKSGFYNQSVTAVPITQFAVLPEKVTDYEIGLKSQWLDDRVRLNAAYYHSIYKNIQKTVQKEFPPGGGQLNRITSNAAAATIDGVEVEANAVLTPELRVMASAAYTRPAYTEFFDGANPATGFAGFDQSGQRFLGVSRWTYSLSGVYARPVRFGRIQAQVDWYWRSDVDFTPADGAGALLGAAPGPGTPDALRIQPGYGLLNASATAMIDKYGLDIRVYVKNLLKEEYHSFIIGLVNAGLGATSGTPGDPRTYGVDLTWRF